MTPILRVYAFHCTRPKHPLQSLVSRRYYSRRRDALASRSFADVGLPEHVVKKLHRAFPNVQRPTAAQKAFIPALLNGNDVLLADTTGSGK